MPWDGNTRCAMPCRLVHRSRMFWKHQAGPTPSILCCWWGISQRWGVSLPNCWKCPQQHAPFAKALSGGCAAALGKGQTTLFCWLSPHQSVCEKVQSFAGRPVLMVGTLAKAFLNEASGMLASACKPARMSSLFLISTLRPKARFFISPICKSSFFGMVKLSRTTLTFLSFKGFAGAAAVFLTTGF